MERKEKMQEIESVHQTALLRFTGHINLRHTWYSCSSPSPTPVASHRYTAKVHCMDDTQYPQQ